MSAALSDLPPAIPPGADNPGLIRFLRAMIADPLGAIPASAYREPITVLTLAGSTIGYVCDPESLEDMLVRRVTAFRKSDMDIRMLRPALGDSLVTAEGESWRWKRRLAAPIFTPGALKKRVPEMVAPFHALAEAWRSAAEGDKSAGKIDSRDIVPGLTRATFDVITRTLFSNQNELDFAALSAAIDAYLAPTPWVVGYASLGMPDWLPHPGRGRRLRARTELRTRITDLIRSRRAATAAGAHAFDDVCADLMSARDPETSRPLGDEDLVDMLLTLITAGHETSANGLIWTLYCVARQPELQTRLVEEIDTVLGRRPVEAADIPALRLAEAVIKESLRLFPAVPLMDRQTMITEDLCGHSFPPGTLLFAPIYALHRHRRFWSEPDRFDANRFLDGSANRVPRTIYMPFGAGPRICIGGTMAMMEMVAGLATLLQSLRFDIAPETHCEPVYRISLRPKGGLRLHVRSPQR